MGRRERREGQREVLKALRQGDAGDVPLVFSGDYVHVRCGGPAKRANEPHVLAWCARCDCVVPCEQVRAR